METPSKPPAPQSPKSSNGNLESIAEPALEQSIAQEEELSLSLSVRRVAIQSEDEGMVLGGSRVPVVLQRGTVKGISLTYVLKRWRSLREARSEVCPSPLAAYRPADWAQKLTVYSDPALLKPLQGVCVPSIAFLLSGPSGHVRCAMVPPHDVGWEELHPGVDAGIKERVIEAFQLIHARGVLHGDVAFRHILFDTAGAVTVLDFSTAQTLDDYTHAGLQRCATTDLERELRIVKYMLDFEDSRVQERTAAATSASIVSSENAAKHIPFSLCELDALDEACNVPSRTFEIPTERRCNRAVFQQFFSRRNPEDSMAANVVDAAGHLEAESSYIEPTRKSKFATYQHRTATHYDAPRANPSILPSHYSGASTHLCTGFGSLSIPSPGTFPVGPNTRVTHGSVSFNAPHTGRRLPPSPRPRPPPLHATSPRSSSTEPLSNSDSQDSVYDTDASSGKDGVTHCSKRKREFAVAFTPNTVDSSPWGDEGRPAKRMHPPTPPARHADSVEDEATDNESFSRFLDAVQSPELNPLEPPPQKESSPSVVPTESVTEEVEDEDGEDPSDVFIVITSPTGQRRVWGVSETLATQVSQMLDHKQDELLVGHERGRSPSPFTAGKKRKSEGAPEEQGRSTLLKKFNGLFSRFLG